MADRGKEMVLLDPDGEMYPDGSFTTLAEITWPSRYPTDEAKVDLHLDCCDIAVDARVLRWLQEHIPTALGWLDA